MAHVIQSLHRFESCFDDRAAQFGYRHPYLATMVMFVGMPVLALAAVGVCTTAIMLPVSLLCGWM